MLSLVLNCRPRIVKSQAVHYGSVGLDAHRIYSRRVDNADNPGVAILECKSVQPGVPSKHVTVDNITDAEVRQARAELDKLIVSLDQRSDAVANAFVSVAAMCPAANPSDL